MEIYIYAYIFLYMYVCIHGNGIINIHPWLLALVFYLRKWGAEIIISFPFTKAFFTLVITRMHLQVSSDILTKTLKGRCLESLLKTTDKR